MASGSNAAVLEERPLEVNPYAVLKNRNFVLYLIGRFIASFGEQMLIVAVGWQLYERTHSALALGMVGLMNIIPMFSFTLLAGHIADSFDRKRVITLGLAGMACAVAGLTLASWWDAPVFWIYACIFMMGTARTFMWPSSSAFLPQLVGRADFPKAVTWNSGSFHLSSVAGPAAGGALIALMHSATAVYVLETFAALTCLILILFVRVERVAPTRMPITLKNLAVGFSFVFSNPIILGIITLDMFAVLLGGATSLLPVYAKDILHVGPSGLGFLQAALPAGALSCSMVLAHRPPIRQAGRTLLWAVAVFGLATVIFGFSRSFAISMLMLYVCGASDNVSVVIRHTLVQLLTPDEKRGRVSAVNSLFIGTSNELGGFESGVVANWLGPIISVVAGGVGTILVVVAVALIWPQIRRYGALTGSPPS
jgi:MFS family permease